MEKNMEKKFILTEDTRVVEGRILHRIRAIKDFGCVKKGSLGGFVEKETNLSHEGNSWVHNNAFVYDDAYVDDNAHIYGNAHICGNAHIYGYAYVGDNAHICGDAHVCDNASVYGKARVYGNAYVCDNARVQFSRLRTDLRKDIKSSLRCQCNLIPENGKVIAYKVVRKDLSSLYDKNFVYKVGEVALCENPREDNSSCSPGLHFSNLTYWDNKCEESLDNLIYLKAEIDLQDIITVQEGKIRCRKAKILSKIEIE